MKSESVAAYERYLELYPEGEHVFQANTFIANWLINEEAWSRFTERFPDHEKYDYAMQAWHDRTWLHFQNSLEHRKTNRYIAGPSHAQYAQFLQRFPNSPHRPEVEARMATFAVVVIEEPISVSKTAGETWRYEFTIRETNGVGVTFTDRYIDIPLNSRQKLTLNKSRSLFWLGANKTQVITGTVSSGEIGGKTLQIALGGDDRNGHRVSVRQSATLK